MSNFVEELKKYFENTPQNKIIEDWSKTAEFDKTGPTVEEFLRFSELYLVTSTKVLNEEINQNLTNEPEVSFGFFYKKNITKNANSSCLLNC